MTNLVVLAVVIVTNFSLKTVVITGTEITFQQTQEVCCVATITDVGTAENGYLFSIQTLQEPCKGVGWVIHELSAIFCKHQKVHQRRTSHGGKGL